MLIAARWQLRTVLRRYWMGPLGVVRSFVVQRARSWYVGLRMTAEAARSCLRMTEKKLRRKTVHRKGQPIENRHEMRRMIDRWSEIHHVQMSVRYHLR